VINPDATLKVSDKPPVKFVRPSFDWLLASAAATYRERTVAVLLSGANCDGVQGARSIAANGGTVIVQDPRTCSSSQLPRAVIDAGVEHWCMSPKEMGLVIIDRLQTANLCCANDWDPFATKPHALP
jgi:two-component system chemotaxis response regulator CheB